MRALAVLSLLRWAGKQIDNLILREIPIAGNCRKNRIQRAASCAEKLHRGRYSGVGLQGSLPGRIQLILWYLALSREDLPQPDLRLKSSKRIGAQRQIRNAIDPICYSDKPGNRRIIQSRKFNENRKPPLELEQLGGHQKLRCIG